jgi:CTP synthase
MSPYQHGEVFVTRDGSETDMDLGHYERFIDLELTSSSSVTAGQVYSGVISNERAGEYLGGTIQTVPHVTNVIKQYMMRLAEESDPDVVVVEVGGTVGDIEGLPFLEAIRQMPNEVGRDNVYYIHVTLLPHISSTGELKTKPTQHSVKELRGIGIQPDCIICRSDFPVPEGIKDKIALFCDVKPEAVIPLQTVDTIYEVPLVLQEAGLLDLLAESLGLGKLAPDLGVWEEIVGRIKEPKAPLKVAVVGKYATLPEAYISVKEALQHAGLFHHRDVEVVWVPSEDVEEVGADRFLQDACGIVVPGGFGPRGVDGMLEAVRYAREHQVPYLGLCLGMQLMVVERSQSCAGLQGANSTEFDTETPHPVIDLMPEQRDITEMGGTMRLGVYSCHMTPGTIAAKACGEPVVDERHRHRFELNNDYRERLEDAGIRFSGLSPDGRLVEIAEAADHPFMVGTQFHPEFRSRPNRPHPLFREFIAVAQHVTREGMQPPLPLDGVDGAVQG